MGAIGPGLLVLVGVGHGDDRDDARALAGKLSRLRVFADEDGKMNRSVRDVEGSVLVVSQFTLYGAVHRGNRPSFTGAAEPEQARSLVDEVVEQLRNDGLPVEAGVFGAMMDIELVNDGPVTLVLRTEAGRLV